LMWNFWRFQRLKGSLPGQARSSRVLLPHNWGSSLLSSHMAFLYRKYSRTCTSLYIWWLHQLVQLSTGTI
jgi:hypothetical protein